MSAVNTDTDTILEVLNDKMDRDGNNLNQSAIDFDVVVEWQTPTAANNYTWYRKYASGWVEQGGWVAADGSNHYDIAVSLPIAMLDGRYHMSKLYDRGAEANTGNWIWYANAISSTTNTSTTCYLSVPSNSCVIGCWWEVKGMAAAVA